MLRHNDKSNTINWLGDLRSKQYVDWIYDTSKDGRTKPAVYFLTTTGIRTLRHEPGTTRYITHRLYGSAKRTPAFIARHLFIADIAIKLQGLNTATSSFTYATRSAYLSGANGPTVMSESAIRPDLLVRHESVVNVYSYFLEYVPTTLPTYRLRTKLLEYLEFSGSHYWYPDNPLPQLLLIAQTRSQATAIRTVVHRIQTQMQPWPEFTIKLARADQIAESSLFDPIWQVLTKDNIG